MKVKKMMDVDGRRVGYRFKCPGCGENHTLPGPALIHGELECPDVITRAHWHFNGDFNKPTFSPSVLVKHGHYCDGDTSDCWCAYYRHHPEEVKEFSCFICHSFVREGCIEFLPDCTHSLVGQKVELPEIDLA
jgi:Family of unknown function (DUF6527)